MEGCICYTQPPPSSVCLVIHLEKLNKESHGHFYTLALADYSVMLLSVLRELVCSAWNLFSRNVYHVLLGSSHCLPPGRWEPGISLFGIPRFLSGSFLLRCSSNGFAGYPWSLHTHGFLKGADHDILTR